MATQQTARLRKAAAMVIVGATCAAALTAPTAAALAADHRDRVGRSGPEGLPVLTGRVKRNFDITISEDSVPAGRYKLVVKDQASAHNYHIYGEGVDEKTTVPGTGKSVWKIDLQEGTYTIQCDPHSSSMRLELEVTG